MSALYWGIPCDRHLETAAEEMLNTRDTAPVPPNKSINDEDVCGVNFSIREVNHSYDKRSTELNNEFGNLGYMKTTLAERISQALAKREWRAADLARCAGVTPAAVSYWKNSRSGFIDGPNLLKVAACLQVRPEWLQFGQGPMQDETPPPPPFPGEERRKLTRTEILLGGGRGMPRHFALYESSRPESQAASDALLELPFDKQMAVAEVIKKLKGD